MSTTNQTQPKVGQIMTIRGQQCAIVQIHPFGTVDVSNVTTGKSFRVTGLSFVSENDKVTGAIKRGEAAPIVEQSTPAQASGNCRTSHSPLPWTQDFASKGMIRDEQDTIVAEHLHVYDAAFIVRACNEYEQTVELLNANVRKVYELTSERDELKAHAQRLADALTKMLKLNIVPTIENVGAAIEARGEKHGGLATVREAREALAQWEGSK